jgi:hypothetical protein
MSTFEEARTSDTITRAEMAKVIVKYADNVLGITPPSLRDTSSITCTFSDLNQTNEELQTYIIQACELGLMGLNADGVTPKKYFIPNEPITLAEVATTISRLLRSNTYRGIEEWWYHSHLLALQKADIIPRNIDPMRPEPRGNVLLILKKSYTLLHQ